VRAGARALFSALDDVGGVYCIGTSVVVEDGESVAASPSRSKALPPQVAVAARTALTAYLSLAVRYSAAACEIVMTAYTLVVGGLH